MTASFTLAILPDTQKYSQSYPQIFTSQTRWIAEHKEDLNIAFVLHEGDVTNGNVEYHWENAKASMSVLDGVLPYAIVLGNHDMGPGGDCTVRKSPLFNRYFPVSKYEQLSTFGGTFEPNLLDNSFHLFHAGETEWLVLALEYLPRDQVLEWANEIIATHVGRRVIFLTHSHVCSDNSLHGDRSVHKWNPTDHQISNETGGVNNGIDVWNKLLKKHSGTFLSFNGHFTENGGSGLVSKEGDAGNQVIQMLANYQLMDNGGNGYLRIVECAPSKGIISVSTYSPFLDEYLTDSRNQFTLTGLDLADL